MAEIVGRLRRWRDPLVLLTLLAIHTIVSAIWLSLDPFEVELVPDQHLHTAETLRVQALLRVFGLAGFVDMIRVEGIYGFLGYLPGGLAALLWGNSPAVMRLANVVFFGVLLWGTYLVGRKCHGRDVGLLAACLVSLTPAAYGGWRTISLDFPLLCATPMALFLLLRTDGFVRLRASAAFGAACGIAVLIKPQALLFLFWPAAAALGLSVWRADRTSGFWAGRGRPLVGAGLTLVTLLATTAIYFVPRLERLLAMFQRHATGHGMEFHEGDLSFLGGLVYFFKMLPSFLATPLVLALFVALFSFVRRRRNLLLILTWLLLPVLVHAVLKVRNFRYLYPLVPAVAVLVSMALASIDRARLRKAATGVLVGAMALMWLTCSAVGVVGFQRIDVGVPSPFYCTGAEPPESFWEFFRTCGAEVNTGPPIPGDRFGGQAIAKQLEQELQRLTKPNRPSDARPRTPAHEAGPQHRTPLVLFESMSGAQDLLLQIVHRIDGEVLLSPYPHRYMPYVNEMVDSFTVLLFDWKPLEQDGWRPLARFRCEPDHRESCVGREEITLWQYTTPRPRQ